MRVPISSCALQSTAASWKTFTDLHVFVQIQIHSNVKAPRIVYIILLEHQTVLGTTQQRYFSESYTTPRGSSFVCILGTSRGFVTFQLQVRQPRWMPPLLLLALFATPHDTVMNESLQGKVKYKRYAKNVTNILLCVPLIGGGGGGGGGGELAKKVRQENLLSIKNTVQNPENALYSSPPQLNDQLCENHHNPNESLFTFCQATSVRLAVNAQLR